MPDRRPAAVPDRRRAAVLGSPISHSRSPDIHLAAYRALGLTSWTYDRIECTAEQLPGLVAELGPEWVGLSVTKPGKFAALATATERTERAALVGSANTLVRTDTGWRADNTDIDGVVGALADHVEAPQRAAVLGSGGTAPAAVAALVSLGVRHIAVLARDRAKAAEPVAIGRQLGADTEWVELGRPVAELDVAVNTLPAEVAARYADTIVTVPVLLDAIYDPWPTPLADAVSTAGGRVVSGLQMLLHQAVAQVEQFTGMTAPQEVMRAALERP
ncbi:shikimate dehydrogenase [Mycolicibacterium neoaurum]|uniref:shikimate dehydrogenase n=1 Tax=Mycolicibacterium neoaurum TaxID=1795 RepID=UPI00248BA0A8|nr:shikimate dehydrogenase [Mycolicibacterium neoaurum]WBP94519.1 shikimate dehydrogenase [Mycolicibacterium neoaurum]WBS08186.1 shikimate dehydrogenase [Mycolicibacterium neoaurum]